MPTTYIIGHKKPDTDAVVAAMALEYFYKQIKCPNYPNPKAVVVDPLNPETNYLMNRFQITPPPQISANEIKPGDKLVLVDHNETDQRLANINDWQITAIIDHHKVNLNLKKPIFLQFRPLGSSASVIFQMMQTKQITPNKTLAALMLAAILSDTVGFKSATTTDKDKELAKELAKLAEINQIDQFALDIFKAKSNVDQLDNYQLATNDYKLFDFGGKKVFVNQIETVEQEKIITERKAGLIDALNQVKQEMGADLTFIAVSDILNVNTKLLMSNDDEAQVAEKAFGGKVVDLVLDIGPKLSRKKEIAPALEQALAG